MSSKTPNKYDIHNSGNKSHQVINCINIINGNSNDLLFYWINSKNDFRVKTFKQLSTLFQLFFFSSFQTYEIDCALTLCWDDNLLPSFVSIIWQVKKTVSLEMNHANSICFFPNYSTLIMKSLFNLEIVVQIENSFIHLII